MKRLGLAAFDKDRSKQYETVGTSLQTQSSDELSRQLKIFQANLVEFAGKHNDELKSNPEFRSKFMTMCNMVGIDPLSLYSKDKHLFDMNDYIHEVCIKIIEVCQETKDINGGIMPLLDILKFMPKNVKEKDLREAVDMLKSLQGGFEIVTIGKKEFLRSVPNELTHDQSKILEVCSILGYAHEGLLRDNLGWAGARSRSILEDMVSEGLLWIDKQSSEKVTLYWDPSWIYKK